MNNIEAMAEMLKYRRPHSSGTERKFIKRFITSLGVECDKFGNRYKRIGSAPIMYSCHTDSVHRYPGMQDIAIKDGVFKLRKFKGVKNVANNCLGADNAAGVWLLREMILAEKPGLYIFHRGEECGGRGSRYITSKTPELVKDIKAAIAFDRRSTKSVITHQWGGRCCSNAFAESLASELKLGHIKDDGGSFTDTANYTNLVPECTNVSVGFNSEHSDRETLDMHYLIELRQAILEYDWEKLVIRRQAGDYEPKTYSYGGNYKKGWANWSGYEDDYESPYAGRTYYKGWSPEKYTNSSKPINKHDEYWKSKKGSYSYRYNKDTNTSELVWTPHEGNVVYVKKQGETEYKPVVGFLPNYHTEDKVEEQGELLPDGHELDESEKPRSFKKELNRTLMIRLVKMNPSLVVFLLQEYGIDLDELADFVKLHHGTIPYELYTK